MWEDRSEHEQANISSQEVLTAAVLSDWLLTGCDASGRQVPAPGLSHCDPASVRLGCSAVLALNVTSAFSFLFSDFLLSLKQSHLAGESFPKTNQLWVYNKAFSQRVDWRRQTWECAALRGCAALTPLWNFSISTAEKMMNWAARKINLCRASSESRSQGAHAVLIRAPRCEWSLKAELWLVCEQWNCFPARYLESLFGDPHYPGRTAGSASALAAAGQ